MSNQKWAKIMAILALIWIIFSVVWTSVLYFIEVNNQEKNHTLTEEDLHRMIKNWQIKISTWAITNSWKITWTWTWN